MATLSSCAAIQLYVPWETMAERKAGWSRKFNEPIMLPDGRVLVTLRDAADYITMLPAKEAALPEWQAAIEGLCWWSRRCSRALAS
jgi:hypothetical protein